MFSCRKHIANLSTRRAVTADFATSIGCGLAPVRMRRRTDATPRNDPTLADESDPRSGTQKCGIGVGNSENCGEQPLTSEGASGSRRPPVNVSLLTEESSPRSALLFFCVNGSSHLELANRRPVRPGHAGHGDVVHIAIL